GQHGQGFPKGQIGVASAGVGAAPAAHDQQGRIGRLSSPPKLLHQGGLALTRAPDDKDNLAGAGRREPARQLCQLSLAHHKQGRGRVRGACFLKKGGQGSSAVVALRGSMFPLLVCTSAPRLISPARICSYKNRISTPGSTPISPARA